MKISDLTQKTQDGLYLLCKEMFLDEIYPDNISSIPSEWAWLCYLLQCVEDDPRYFPSGKWATIQFIQGMLEREARAEVRGYLLYKEQSK